MTNVWLAGALAGLAASILLWALLYLAYRLDRPDAASVALLTVVLLVPPLLSYLAVMRLTGEERPLRLRSFLVYLVALLWLGVQRVVIYPAFGLKVSIGESLANFILLPPLGIAAWMGAQSLIYRLRMERAVALQEDTELRLLEAQLAPHMLFNMLNTVYAALLTNREEAVELFLKMSDALRHLSGAEQRAWAPLSEELSFVENYSALERARSASTVIVIKAEGEMDTPVPTMILTTLFENAVKHGRLANGGVDVSVDVRSTDETIRLQVKNRFDPDRRSQGAGIGLANLKGRMALLYPGGDVLVTGASGDIYEATMVLKA